MNAEALRSIQAPLKERYRETPDGALITLRAQGRIAEGVSCKEQLATLSRLTERYCVVYQTLSNPPALAVTGKRATASAPR